MVYFFLSPRLQIINEFVLQNTTQEQIKIYKKCYEVCSCTNEIMDGLETIYRRRSEGKSVGNKGRRQICDKIDALLAVEKLYTQYELLLFSLRWRVWKFRIE